jgi:hypothetical protein
MRKKCFISFEYDNEDDLNHILTNIFTVMVDTGPQLAPYDFPLYKAGNIPERAGQAEVFLVDREF